MGLTNFGYETGLSGGEPGTLPAYAVIARWSFATVENLQNGLGAHGAELIGDIPNFTGVQPIMQVSQIN
ncbi:EthD family reductase [Spirosoma jeollabukense]